MNNTKTPLLWLLWLVACLASATAQNRLTNLPTLYIDTQNKAPIQDKTNYVPGTITIVSSNPAEEMTAVPMGIRGRGNSTWGMAKKPYRVKFDAKQNLLQLDATLKNWVLLANYADKTLMRNALAFKIGNYVGMEWTPGVAFVDVVLNGVYRGTYMATDQVEINKGRIPAEEQKPTQTTEPDITGGYLLEIDGFASGEPVWFQTNRAQPITVKYPKDDEINPQQLEYIKKYVRSFEDLLFAEHFADPETGYRKRVDENSIINWYIACELTGNSDAFWSVYMYKKRNVDKLFFGPLWDFDIAFNNDNRLGDATEKLMRQHAHNPKEWVRRFWDAPWFRQEVNKRWKELLAAGMEEELLSYIDHTEQLLQQSQVKNFDTWKILNKPIYREVKLFDTYAEGVDFLRDYLRRRIAFLTQAFEKADAGSDFKPFVPDGFYYTIMNVTAKNVVDLLQQATTVDTKLVTWNLESDRTTQHWEIRPVGETKTYQLINRAAALAARGNGSGSRLRLTTPDATDSRQLWRIETLEDGYGLVNVGSGYAIDNSGGGLGNENPVIEWKNELQTNRNQMWYLERVEPIISSVQPQLALPQLSAYFAHNVLTIETLAVTDVHGLEVYDTAGKLVLARNEPVDNRIDVSALPRGVYIIKVRTSEGVVSLKLMK